jgi:hypothetical protein
MKAKRAIAARRMLAFEVPCVGIDDRHGAHTL